MRIVGRGQNKFGPHWKYFVPPPSPKLNSCEFYHLICSFGRQKSYHSKHKTRDIKSVASPKTSRGGDDMSFPPTIRVWRWLWQIYFFIEIGTDIFNRKTKPSFWYIMVYLVDWQIWYFRYCEIDLESCFILRIQNNLDIYIWLWNKIHLIYWNISCTSYFLTSSFPHPFFFCFKSAYADSMTWLVSMYVCTYLCKYVCMSCSALFICISGSNFLKLNKTLHGC